MFSLEGKRAFITGGASGIGVAVAERFVAAGAGVTIADIVDGAPTAERIGAQWQRVDVGDEASVAEGLEVAADRGGRFDIIISNAGVGDVGERIEGTDQAVLAAVTRVNQWGPFYMLKHGPQHMNDGGSFINTASMAAFWSTIGTAVYSATKRAVVSLTEMAALELGGRGIRVNAVCPTYIATSMVQGDEGTILSESLTALGRMGTVDDVTGVYHFLAADESRYMTGQALKVDGGRSCGPSQQLLEQLLGHSVFKNEQIGGQA